MMNSCQFEKKIYTAHGIGQTGLKIIEQIIEITEYASICVERNKIFILER